MLIRVDTKQVTDVRIMLTRSAGALDRDFTKKALRKSLRPMLNSARAKAPVSGAQYRNRRNATVGAERISLSKRGRPNPNEYRRGGATRRDLRILVVDDREQRVDVMGLVGVSKRKGKVGWRTHFITRQVTLNGRPYLNPKHDFLERAFTENYGTAVKIFEMEAKRVYEGFLRRASTSLSRTGS